MRYEVDPARATAFYASIRAFWPGLPTTRCSRRTRASGRSSRGEPPADFIVQGAAQHGVRAVNLFGIESPATASLALAQRVGDMTAYR